MVPSSSIDIKDIEIMPQVIKYNKTFLPLIACSNEAH